MITLDVDLSAILSLAENMQSKIEKVLQDAAKNLSAQTHAHILEEVNSKLHSTRDKYIAALHYDQQDPDTWVISLDKSAMWIEEGKEPGSMIDSLLRSPKAKTAADGSRYVVVPFQHNKGPTKQTQAQKDLTDTLKSEMKKRKIPYGKIETDDKGNAKVGLLHSFDVMHSPLKTHEGPGMGKGPIGQPRQGDTGTPFLRGIRVYQKEVRNQATGKSKVTKQIMTFRVASSRHAGTGKWMHPGTEAKHFFEDAEKWAKELWDKEIAPSILEQLAATL
jgi:hypothetical protein